MEYFLLTVGFTCVFVGCPKINLFGVCCSKVTIPTLLACHDSNITYKSQFQHYSTCSRDVMQTFTQPRNNIKK